MAEKKKATKNKETITFQDNGKEYTAKKGEPIFDKPTEADKLELEELKKVNEKRQNKEQALKDYFRVLCNFRRWRQMTLDLSDAIDNYATLPYIPLHPDTGIKLSRDYLIQLHTEHILELRILGAQVQKCETDLKITWDLTEDDIAKEWSKWFGNEE